MTSRFFNGTPQFFTDSGKVVAGGFINFWATGTTNNQDTFPTAALSGANANPVPLDAAGRPTVNIFADPSESFSVRVIDADSVVIVPTIDNVSFVRSNVITAADAVAALTANAVAGVYNGTQMTGTAYANFASNFDLTAAGSIDTSLGSLTVTAVAGAAVFADLSADGDVTANTGNFVIGTSGKGVDFTANTDDSGGTISSEIMTDFEEGTYTVTIVGSSSGSLGMSSATLAYQKIGKVCFIQGTLVINADNSLSGDARFLLPFTSADLMGLAGRTTGSVALVQNGTAFESPRIFIDEGEAFFRILDNPSDGISAQTALSNTNSDAAFTVQVSFSYFVA